MTRPAGASTVADPAGTETVKPGEFSVKAKSITKGGATIVATAVFTVVTAGSPTTVPPTTTPPLLLRRSPPSGTHTADVARTPRTPACRRVTLQPSGAPFTVTQNGAVVNGLDINGCLVIRANNVTVQNTRVRQNDVCWGGAIDVGYTNSGIVVKDTEIDGGNHNGWGQLIGNSGYTCIRCNLHNGGHGFHMNSNVTVLDSYVHDLYHDPATQSHNDAAISNGGDHLVLRHNNLNCDAGNAGGGGCTGAIVLLGDFAPISYVTADNNLLNGGAFALYAGSLPEKPYAHADHVVITNNKFGKALFPLSGVYGPVTGYEAAAPGNQIHRQHVGRYRQSRLAGLIGFLARTPRNGVRSSGRHFRFWVALPR